MDAAQLLLSLDVKLLFLFLLPWCWFDSHTRDVIRFSLTCVPKESSPSPLYDALSVFPFPCCCDIFSSSDHIRPSLLLFIHVSIIRCPGLVRRVEIGNDRDEKGRVSELQWLQNWVCAFAGCVTESNMELTNSCDVVLHVKFCCHRKIWILSMCNICSARRVRAQAYHGSARVGAGGTSN